MTRARTSIVAAAATAAAAIAPAAWLFDFTVDDALIPARYAAHLTHGFGYRFNARGPITDGVTPLGFPYLLAPFASNGPFAALAAAKWIGLVAWIAGAAALGVAIARSSERASRFFALALVAASAPLAAWSVAGLETGITTSLAAFALLACVLDRPRAGALLAGLAAWLRPELVVWALLTGASPRPRSEDAIGARLVRVTIAGAPFLLVVALRLAIFHRPAPLAVLAKPSDLAHGATYAAACFALTGPVALVAPLAWRRLAPFERWTIAAVFAHFVVVAIVGGDWMPLSRLVVPVLPSVALGAAFLARASAPAVLAARLVLALGGELFALAKIGPTAARIGSERAAVARELAPAIAPAEVVATLDVGWVGAVTDATIVDLAGLTDPAIAALPGGHTNKEIPATLLDRRGVDALVLLRFEGKPIATPWSETWFARAVEDRVAEIPDVGRDFAIVAASDRPHLGYVVARRAARPATPSADENR